MQYKYCVVDICLAIHEKESHIMCISSVDTVPSIGHLHYLLMKNEMKMKICTLSKAPPSV